MFGQNNDDQQQVQDDHNIFGQPADASSVPAPGAPVGPLTQDVPTPFGSVVPPSDPEPPTATVVAPAAGSDDLLDIKQEALQELTPLVGHLEQSPEEKFRTTMMMIQASDDHSLVKIAYGAAKEITDEKARAQALLDIVNEINYFTQQHHA